MTGPRTGGRDRGSASLWLLAVGLTLVMAGMAGAAVGAARVAKRQARAAADFGALAGAARTLEGPAVACVRAADLVTANGGRMVECVVDDLDLQLVVEMTVHPLPGLTRVARATARAGPIRS
ncbi:Rv3654c family TadE-like protein [Micromonospora sp. NPDC050417]|uniref:Rv3654c family TadE-like protein n=1 Tax=Micromonospora sp. NPDC050417 TaxID=3364280 RepID=UPI0037A34584